MLKRVMDYILQVTKYTNKWKQLTPCSPEKCTLKRILRFAITLNSIDFLGRVETDYLTIYQPVKPWINLIVNT